MKKSEIILCESVSCTLIEKSGEGGKGEVWKAKIDDCCYAIKFLKINPSTNDKKRFEQERIFCRENNHDNIVRCIGQGVHSYKHKDKIMQQLYYIMPFYTKTFRNIIKSINDSRILIRYFLQLCDAVKFIHDKGIFHRDIKPENILWDENNNQIYLADFGIAHLPNSQLTVSNERLANFNYHAPEQKKDSGLKTTSACDIYALGLILNECFTKQIISGVNYKKIKDKYPLYQDIDLLIKNMIKQMPENRFKINMVITQLKLIQSRTEREIEYITKQLKDVSAKQLNLNSIKHAAKDIAFAKKVFRNNEIEHINPNWHCKNGIGYNASTWLSSLCVQEQILEKVKNKFYYESNLLGEKYSALDMRKLEDKALYEEMLTAIRKYNVEERRYDLSNKIMKYFASCCDYHCRELLNGIKRKECNGDFLKNIKQAPILWLVGFLKQELKESLFELQSDEDFNFSNYIEVDWEFTNANYNEVDAVDDLADSIYYSSVKEAEEILQSFQEILSKRGIEIQTELDNNDYLIYISGSQYEKLENMRMIVFQEIDKLSKDNLLKYDTSDLFRIREKQKDIVVLKWNIIFDIKNTLKKLVDISKQ